MNIQGKPKESQGTAKEQTRTNQGTAKEKPRETKECQGKTKENQ